MKQNRKKGNNRDQVEISEFENKEAIKNSNKIV
jgi:hypothetical protein